MKPVPVAHLLVLPASGAPFVAPLEGAETVIGSGRDASLRIADPEIASHHATIHRSEAGYLIDRHATPFQVNGRKARQHVLQPFDLISLGRTALSFRLGPPAPAIRFVDQPSALDLCRKLNAFTRGVEDGANREELAERLLRDVLSLTGATRGALVRLVGDEAEAEAVGFTSTVHGDFSEQETSFSRTVIARMRDQGGAILIKDTQLDRDLAHAPSILAAGTGAVMCAPIRRGDQLVGALYVSAPGNASFSPTALELVDLYAHQAVYLLASAERDRTLTARLVEAEQRAQRDSTLIGSSAAMQTVRTQLGKLALHDIPVLLGGETGTGKEVVAREIHRLSPRAEGPFVAVDCGAIPESLFQSEMFGHVRGAFTHAHQDRKGRVRSANGGTLFLDEVGEMPLSQQVMLLRVLQEQTVAPVGGEQSYPVDFRLVCATNRDLEQDVSAGRFRQDLYFRIAGVALGLPPLREREDDAIELAQVFLRRHRESLGRSDVRFTASALAAIRRSPWAGNVRELEAAVRKGVVLCEGATIGPSDLGVDSSVEGNVDVIRPLALERDEYLKGYVKRVVDRCGGNRGEAAKALMVSVRTVFKYLEEL